MLTVRPENPSTDSVPIEALFDATFGPGHFAKTAERLREFSASLPRISRVAVQDDALVAVCRVWPISVGGQSALFYGPVAVSPEFRGSRLGLTVTGEALEAGADAGWHSAILIGAPRYFGEIGFEPVPPGQMTMPGPQDASRILARNLKGDWRGLSGPCLALPCRDFG